MQNPFPALAIALRQHAAVDIEAITSDWDEPGTWNVLTVPLVGSPMIWTIWIYDGEQVFEPVVFEDSVAAWDELTRRWTGQGKES